MGRTIACTDSSRETKTHCSKAATRHNRTLLFKLKVATRYHLVLSYIVYKNRFTMGCLGNNVRNLSHQQRTFGRMNIFLYNTLLFLFGIFIEGSNPFFMLCLIQQSSYSRKTLLTISQNSDICFDILIKFRCIDIQMNDLCLLCISLGKACYAVTETHSDGY